MVRIYINFNRNPLTIYQRPLATLWKCFTLRHYCSLSQPVFSLEMHSYQPVYDMYFLNSLSNCRVVRFLREAYQVTQECHKAPSPKSYAMFVRLAELPRDRMGFDWGWPHQAKTIPSSESWGETCSSRRANSGCSWSDVQPDAPDWLLNIAVAIVCAHASARLGECNDMIEKLRFIYLASSWLSEIGDTSHNTLADC